MPKEKYTVDYFIDKFSKLNEEDFCTEAYKIEIDNPRSIKYCALGHCGENIDGKSIESKALSELLESNVSYINDGFSILYKQPTPKQRILAALNDKLKQQKK